MGEVGGGGGGTFVSQRMRFVRRSYMKRGLGFGVWGLGFGVWSLEFRVWGLGYALQCPKVLRRPNNVRTRHTSSRHSSHNRHHTSHVTRHTSTRHTRLTISRLRYHTPQPPHAPGRCSCCQTPRTNSHAPRHRHVPPDSQLAHLFAWDPLIESSTPHRNRSSSDTNQRKCRNLTPTITSERLHILTAPSLPAVAISGAP